MFVFLILCYIAIYLLVAMAFIVVATGVGVVLVVYWLTYICAYAYAHARHRKSPERKHPTVPLPKIDQDKIQGWATQSAIYAAAAMVVAFLVYAFH